DVAAQHARTRESADLARERCRQRRFAGAAEAADRDEAGRSRLEQAAREIEIGADLGNAGGAVARGGGAGGGGCSDMAADGGAQRCEERHQGNAVGLVAAIEIAVEDEVGEAPEPAMREVHQQEGEVVEYVDGGERRIELDAVERNRAAIDEAD